MNLTDIMPFHNAKFFWIGRWGTFNPPSTGWHSLQPNNEFFNDIPGASLDTGSGQFTLPTGKYMIELGANPVRSNTTYFMIYSITNSATAGNFTNVAVRNWNEDNDGIGVDQLTSCEFLEVTLSEEVFEWRVNFGARNTSSQISSGGTTLGSSDPSGETQKVYNATALIIKVE